MTLVWNHEVSQYHFSLYKGVYLGLLYFILRVFAALHLLKFLDTNNARVKTDFPLLGWTESHYGDTASARTVSIVMGNLEHLRDARTKLAENECRKHSHTVSLHWKICQKVSIWSLLNQKQMLPSKINSRSL